MKRATDITTDQYKTPRCQAQRTGRYLNDKPDTDYQCSHRSRFKVAGRYYCLRHAEIAALHILMSEDEGQLRLELESE